MTVLVKLCGNRSLHDIQTVRTVDVDYIGVIFAESKRKAEPERLREWLFRYPLAPQQKLVGVFVHPDMKEVEYILDTVSLNVIQLHGNETPSYVLNVKETTGIPVWKAIRHQEKGIESMKSFEGLVDGFVIDSKVKGAWGGTGIQFDWNSVPEYTREAKRQGVPCFIAGGIRPENVGIY